MSGCDGTCQFVEIWLTSLWGVSLNPPCSLRWRLGLGWRPHWYCMSLQSFKHHSKTDMVCGWGCEARGSELKALNASGCAKSNDDVVLCSGSSKLPRSSLCSALHARDALLVCLQHSWVKSCVHTTRVNAPHRQRACSWRAGESGCFWRAGVSVVGGSGLR